MIGAAWPDSTLENELMFMYTHLRLHASQFFEN
jgi:hypothetical protein